MAEKEYTVVAPDGKEITLIGPVGASQEEVIAQAQKLYNPSQAQQKPSATAKDMGNIINTDVPTVVGTRPNAVNPQPVQQPRSVADYAKAFLEVPATVATSAVAPFINVGAGMIENMRQGTNQRVDRPELAQRFTYEPTSPVSQDVLTSLGETLSDAKLPAYMPALGTTARATQQTAKTITPMVRGNLPSFDQASAPKPSLMAEGLRQAEPKPSVLQGVAQRYKEAFTPEPKPNYATAEQLESASNLLFKQAKDANILIDTKQFTNSMSNLGKELRQEGYTPTAYPKITAALDELTNAGIPKDYTELRALRKIIQGAQKSTDGEEKRLATILKSQFDDYVLNIPESAVTQGSKEGLKAWKEARDIYSRMSKAEIFEDMLDKAEITKGKFSQSGLENALFTELKNLAVNPKKMKMFTKEEQAAIRQAAEGTTAQNALRLIGKFAPTSTVSSILPLLVTGASAPIGLAGTAAAIGARVGATQMRKNQVEQLANLMRGTLIPENQVAPKPVNEQLIKMLRINQGE
jgi:hypothetical protein